LEKFLDPINSSGWARAPKLKDYLAMQCIKRSSTLRISSKENKQSPRIVFRYGNQDSAIKTSLIMENFSRDDKF